MSESRTPIYEIINPDYFKNRTAKSSETDDEKKRISEATSYSEVLADLLHLNDKPEDSDNAAKPTSKPAAEQLLSDILTELRKISAKEDKADVGSPDN